MFILPIPGKPQGSPPPPQKPYIRWTVDDHIFMQEALAQVGLDSASASVGAGASCPSHPGDSLEPALPLAIESAGTLCIG